MMWASKFRVRLSLLLTAAVILALAALYSATLYSNNEGEISTQPLPESPSATAARSSATVQAVEKRSAVSMGKPLSAMNLLDGGSPARALFPELLRLANAGDTEAMVALQWLSIHCSPYRSRFGPRDHPRQSLVNLPAGSPERVVREQALQMASSFCDGPFAPGELVEASRLFSERLQGAARVGDPVARAAAYFEGESEAAKVSAYLETANPWVAESALMAFATSDGPLAREIDSEVFPSTMRSASPQEVTRIKLEAARWRGCQLGRSCGANQINELNRCVVEGECALGQSVQMIIQQRELSGRQFDLMQRYLTALDAKIGRGG